MQIKASAAATRQGSDRNHNEDALLVLHNVPVFAVADGMGGVGVGDRASQIAMDVVRTNAAQLEDQIAKVAKDRSSRSRLDLTYVLETAFQWAHLEVQRDAESNRRVGMATTLAMATVAGDHAYIGHVGNSRAYLYRDGRLQRLTDDHSMAMLRYRSGRMSSAELEQSPERHRLYQVLGAGNEIDVDTAEVALADDDVLLLCTDGLYESLRDAEIATMIDRRNLEQSATRLVERTKALGRPDDVSVVLVRVGSERDTRSLDEIAGILRSVFLFRDLSEAERLVIAPYLEERTLGRGEVLAREGEQGDEFYVLVDGSVRITRGNTHLVDVGPGGHLGELALSRPAERSATVTALEPVRLFVLSRESFQTLVRRRPALGVRLTLALLDAVGDRLRDLTERVRDLTNQAHDHANALVMVKRIATGNVKVEGRSLRDAVLAAARGELKGP